MILFDEYEKENDDGYNKYENVTGEVKLSINGKWPTFYIIMFGWIKCAYTHHAACSSSNFFIKCNV